MLLGCSRMPTDKHSLVPTTANASRRLLQDLTKGNTVNMLHGLAWHCNHLYGIFNLSIQHLVQVIVLLQPVIAAPAVLVIVGLYLFAAVTSANLPPQQAATPYAGTRLDTRAETI